MDLAAYQRRIRTGPRFVCAIVRARLRAPRALLRGM